MAYTKTETGSTLSGQEVQIEEASQSTKPEEVDEEEVVKEYISVITLKKFLHKTGSPQIDVPLPQVLRMTIIAKKLFR